MTTRFRQSGIERKARAMVAGITAGRQWEARALGAAGLGLGTSRLGLETEYHDVCEV